ncbi:MAG: vWA domain-containing protein [Gaiellaceae bacterium]
MLPLVLLGLLALAVHAARGLGAPAESLVPQGRSGVIVLDLSRSISPGPLTAERKALQRLDSADDRVGLVAFSDSAYELLPPGSSGLELRPIIRFFTPIANRRDRAGDPVFPVDPWTDSFRGGTQISVGLQAGLGALRRAGIHDGALLLVSDLADQPEDLQHLLQVLIVMRREHVAVKILGLNPRPADRKLFERLAGASAFVGEPPPLGAAGFARRLEAGLREPVPWALIGVAFALLAVLGLNELLCGRLSWRSA